MKLSIAPDQDGYQLENSMSSFGNKLGGGAMRIRRDYLNAPYKVTVTWTLDADEFNYIKTFHRFIDDGNQPFLMDLLVDNSELTEHECRFLPGQFKLGTVKGMVRKVSAQLEVVPLPADDAYDEGLVTTYEAFGSKGSESYSLLAQIINVDMPANIR